MPKRRRPEKKGCIKYDPDQNALAGSGVKLTSREKGFVLYLGENLRKVSETCSKIPPKWGGCQGDQCRGGRDRRG